MRKFLASTLLALSLFTAQPAKATVGVNTQPFDISNIGLTAVVSSNTLVVTMTTKAGAVPTTGNPVSIAYRSSVATTGKFSRANYTATNAITLGATDSIGARPSVTNYIYVSTILDTTSEVCLSTTLPDEGTLQSATALTGSADVTPGVIYCTSAHTSKPLRVVGRINLTFSNPNWASITEILIGNSFEKRKDYWMVDANISGAGNFDLGTSNQATYRNMDQSGQTLTAASWSMPVGIACSTPATEQQEVGDTSCTGSEGNASNGVTFNVPAFTGSAIVVRACAAFANHIVITNASVAAAAEVVFQLVETPNNALTGFTNGTERLEHRFSANTTTSNNYNSTVPYQLCSNFTFTSSGQKTLRVYYEQSVSGNVTGILVWDDGSTSTGQRDVHWFVEPKFILP